MNTNLRSWLVIGVSANWSTSLSQPLPLWGLRPRFQSEFNVLQAGDILWIYVTSPVKGVVGVGAVKDKYIDRAALIWPEEKKRGEVIWPLRFRIQVLRVIPESVWKTAKIAIGDLGLNWQVGFQLLHDKHAAELSMRAQQVFGADLYSGPSIVARPVVRERAVYTPETRLERAALSHRGLQELVAEIGKLQYYHTELEYPIDLSGEHKSLDVVWKRELSGVPTFAFEVELSTGFEKAIARLKFAYKRWNSRPRIIVPSEHSIRVSNILETEDRDFSQQFRMYEPDRIVDLSGKKRGLRVVEQELGIY